MLFFLRQIRRKAMKESKFSTYLMYALGEFILVVVGILVAVQIDDWSRDREQERDELEVYQLILEDLRRDSVLFGRYQAQTTLYLDTYYRLNYHTIGAGSLADIPIDLVVSNIEFNPVTQNNHQASIDKLRNREVREQINVYFARLSTIKQATREFNGLIERSSRPFFLLENGLFKNEEVFNTEDRTFPPFRGVSVLDPQKFESIMQDQRFKPMISVLRMGIGYYLANLERTIEDNHALITNLESKLK